MQLFKRVNIVILALFSTGITLTSCNNDKSPEPALSITGINPASAPVGTDITISGTEFGTSTSAVTVTFSGNVSATPKAVTSTSITTTVPAGAQDGPVTVKVGDKTVTSSTSFTLSAKAVQEVSGRITADQTWTADKVYLLKGYVYVNSGVTLTIKPGTVIKGGGKDLDPNGRAATLIITKGAKIMAEGTETQPIVFTSSKAAGSRYYGDWGGVVIAGNGTHNQITQKDFEGGIEGNLAPSASLVANDNSGVLKYVRIEFAGVALSAQANSEINGLTLYGVGSGTTIDYVQVSYSGDDSFEWFGGSVNAKHLVAYRTWDDDFDTDFGYNGKVQYALALRDPEFADQSGSNGFESDNQSGDGTNSGTAPEPYTAPVFANVSVFGTSGTPTNATIKGNGGFQSAMHLRRATSLSVFNSLFVGFPEGLRLDNATTLPSTVGNPSRMQIRKVILANVNTDVRGANGLTDTEAKTFFNTTAFANQIIAAANVSTLSLNDSNWKLDATVNFLPKTGSPLLTGAVWTDKASDSFFTKENFIGAFGTTNWTANWTNFNPQNTNYDK
ncbi:cell shape-determining protein MreB [Siphonobacter sp. SORGH_AS_0500]|uniref:IPT/TIG domain-containing protein n=1 Tax=Siphonobacter sp. SORGH_AS_0500 TaxID=1864824 RepID=UPI000CA7C5F2|nr:IPT/TIG domain-containing protein [Siphonobacter sp. SORGH_AS_0500]PKK37951.1 cell shape-determining protein MreB [Siphonobacter sp. SORGH_AS_0500]